MKQKLDDLKLLVMSDRKTQVGLGIAVLAVVGAMLYNPAPPQRPTKRTHATLQGTGATGAEEAYQDLVRAFRTDLDTVKTDVTSMKTDVERQRKEMEENVIRTSDIFKKILERIAENEGSPRGATGSTASVSVEDVGDVGVGGSVDTAPLGSFQADAAPPAIEQFSVPPPQVAPPPPPPPNKVAFVGVGDSVKVELLTGVNAPTDGTPYPVMFKLVSDIIGPDGSTLPLGEARLVAAAQGSLSDQRALFRLSSLNIRYPDGSRNVFEVDGWVVGEDGIRGMEGLLIDPIGKAIGASAFSGAMEGLGDAFAASNISSNMYGNGTQTMTVSGSEAEFAAGKGLSGAAKSWSRLVESRVNKLVPHVQVLSGRQATAIFSRSFRVPGLLEQYEDSNNSFNSLD